MNQRALSTLTTTLVLSALLTACSGGGGGGSSDTPAPAVPSTSLSLSVSSSALTLSEDFSSTLRIATATNATDIRVSQSPTGVVNVTTSVTGVSVSSILNVGGRTTLTITASSGTLSTATQVVVQVIAVNDPPTLTVSSNSISTVGGFSPITINTTASDIEDANLTFTVSESTTGVVRVTQSVNAINLSSIPNASGQTTLTIIAVDSSGSTVTQTIAVNVTVRAGAIPVLMVSTNRISVQEDFGSVVIRTTVTDSDSTTLTLAVTTSMRLVNVEISTRTNDLSTITLTAIANLNGTATLTFRATDDGGQTNSTEIVVVVAAVNDPPTLTVPTATLTVLEDFDGANSVATFADVDRGDALTVTVTESSTGIVTVTTSASGVSVSAIAHRNGRTTLNISVSDGNLSSTTQVGVTVTAVNDPPVLTVSTSALTLAEDFRTVLIATTRTDIDSTTLTLTVAESASGIVSVSTSSADVQLRSTDNISGVTTLTITLSDGTTSTSIQVSVIVTAVNDTPTLSVSTTALTLNEDFATTRLITVNRSDIENDTLTLSVAGSMSGVVIVSTSSAGPQVVSIANASGQTTLTITVSDSQASASTQVIVTVNAVNDTPTLTVSSNSISTVGGFSPITINTTASDVEDDNISFTVMDANTGVVTVTQSANAIILNTIAGASGRTTLTLRVVDSSGVAVTEIITVSVSITPSAAPVVTVSTNLISVREDFGTSVIIQTTATDADSTDTITVLVSASELIVTAVVSTPVVGQSTITNRITLTAIRDVNGTATLTVLARDTGGQSHSTEIIVVVSPVQDAPTLNIPTAALTVAEDFASTLTIATANDDDGDPLLLSVVESTTGVVTVTTTASAVLVSSLRNANGQTTLTITVNDGTQDTTAQMVVNVTPVNDPPSLNIPSATLTRLEDFVGAMTVATATDVDGNPLTFTVTESTTGVIRVTTSASDVRISSRGDANGVTTLSISVSDGRIVSSTAQVVLTVTPVNDPPVLTVSTNALTLAEDFATFLIGTTRSDIDSNTLTLTVAESATGVVTVTITDAGVQVANITDTNGVTTLTLSLSDSELTATTQVVVTVTPVNDPPALSVSTTALTLNEDFSTTEVITVSRSDIDSNTLTLTVSESTTGVVSVTITDAGVQVANITDTNGVTTLTISLSDSELTTTAQVVVTVTPVNDPPALSVSTTALTLNEDFATSVLIGTTRTDIDSNTLTLTVAESATGVVTVTITDAGVQVANITNTNGVTTLTISLSDSELTTTAQVVVTVTPVNDPPALSVSTTALTLNEDFSTTEVITVSRSDIDSNTLTLTVSESTTGVVSVTITDAGVQVANITDTNGVTTLTISLSDSELTTTAQVVVTVTPVNDPPTLSVSINNLSLNVDFSTITINVTLSDVEDSTLSFSVVDSNAGVVTITTLTNTILVNAIAGASGQTTLTVSLVDSSGTTVTQTISVIVSPTPNSAPVLVVSTNHISVQEDFMGSVVIRTTVTDADGDTITISVSSTSRFVDVAISTPINGKSTITNSITLTALSNLHGTTTLNVQAMAAGQSVSTNVVVVVASVDDTPTLTVSSNSITTVGGFSTITINTTASDIEDSALSFAVQASPVNVVRVTTSANAIILNAISGATGQTTLTVRAADLSGTTVTRTISVNVINSAPVLMVSTNLISVQEDFMTSVMFSITAADIDGDTITISVSSTTHLVDAALSIPINGQSTITLSAINNANGTTTLNVQAMADRQSVSTNVVVVVAPVNDTPTLTVSSNSITTVGGFSTITINTTASDIEDSTLSFTVSAVPTGVVTVTTSANAITLNAIANVTGQSTLTVRVVDSLGTMVTQVISVIVSPTPNSAPVLVVSTNRISVQEDFNGSVVIRTTATDAEGDTMTLSVSSTSRLVDVAISTPINGKSTITNSITLTAITDLNGTTTLTVQARDIGGQSTFTEIVVVINAVDDPIRFTLSTSAVSLSVHGSQLDRIVNAISISKPDNKALRAQIRVTTSGDNIFSANPIPVVSFTTNALTTTTTLISTVSTAQLYFTVAPNGTGTGTLVVQLTDLDNSITTQQTMVVSVNSVNVPPVIAQYNSSLTRLTVYGGRLYANDVTSSTIGISRFLTTARALGGHLVNINSVEEYSFVRSPASSGLVSREAYFGLVLPKRLFPGELSWITHDSTIAYGYSSTNGITNHTLYPGQYSLPWATGDAGIGLLANRFGPTTTVSNWTIFSDGSGGVIYLVDNGGDIPPRDRNVIYEFPQGLPIASNSTPIRVISSASVRLTGYDLNGDTINTSNWSGTDSNGGSAVFTSVYTQTGIQSVNMVYTPPANFDGQTTVVVTLQVNSLSTTYAISFIVDGAPNIALSTNAITLNEDFGTFDIGTTATDQGVSTSLPFSVRASTSGIVTISTSVNNIQLSAVQHANGPVTLTVQTIDAASQSTSALIVVNVQAVNDTPTLTVSTNSISILGGVSIITIDTTATDVEDGLLSFSVQSSTTGMLSITTSANTIVLDTIYNASVQTTLTVTVVDSSNTTVVQTIAVNVIITPSATPVLTVSTNLIRVDEDFPNPVVIRTTATDAVGDTIMLSVSSSSYLVDAVLSTPIDGVSTITNTITLTSMTNLNGTTTLTVRATDGGGISVTEQIVVVVNPVDDAISFTLSTSAVSLSAPGSQLDRIVNGINISNPGNKTLSAQFQVTSSGDPIFSTNPAPVVSFTTNALTTVITLASTTPTAQLYFTIAPNSTGTATLTVHLTNLATSDSTQQTLVVQVNPVNVPPAIVPASSSLTRLVVHGGRLYANDATASTIGISRFLTTARALGGHLININSAEEYSFVRSPTSSGLLSSEAYFGLVLAQRLFPGELSWITHDSTIAYGYSSTNGITNHTIYPGQYLLPWATGTGNVGLQANRFGSTTTVSNWTIFAGVGSGVVYLVDNGGDGLNPDGSPVRDRNVVYEFPQGLAPTSINPISLNSGTNVNISLTGFDLNGDTISTNDWSITDPNGGSAIFNHTTGNTGVQTVIMTYTAPANFSGQTTVAVTLLVNGLSTTYAISFMVDGPPTIALSTNAITLAEDFSNFVIGTTVTDQGVSGNLPFSVQTTSMGIMNLSTTINSIQFSGATNFFGTVTLTVQATDSTAQTASTLVVVTVQAVNDTPTVSFSTDNISTLGGFSPITIDTTATDVEQSVLSFSVQASPKGVVSISTNSNAIVLSPIVGGSGRTTLTVSVDDGNKIGIQTIAVNVMVTTSASTPVLRVSTNLISLQEDFAATFMIGTTATDVESGTLVVTVSSTTHLVNTVISTHSIALSSVADLFGTTTLTVRARDAGGVFVSTEIVVIVASVNDTPTLSVSSNTVILSSASLLLGVTASDLEDGALSFGTSSGQGYVNIALTTTRLTLTRLYQSGQVILTLTSTDTDGGTASTVVRVTIPPFLDVTTGIKTLDFAWSAVSATSHYQLRSNPDGNSGFTDLSTTGIVVSPNSTDIKQTTAQGLVSLHRYIPRVVDPQYEVYPCNGTSCGASIGNMVVLTNAQLNGMIGRLQANNPDSEDYFGFSVDLSGDGNTLAVGAYGERGSSTGVNGAQSNDSANTGAVYLYRRMGGVWSQQAYIKASNSDPNDQFGWSVSLNDDGNTLAVGANLEDGSATGVNGAQNGSSTNDSGAVYVFRFSSSTWSQQAYIKASNTGDGDRFGHAVALSGDGNTLAVGVPNEDSRSRGVNSIQNNDGSDLGATYLFRFDGGMWSQQAYIKASNAPFFGDRFGQSVSLNKDGNTLAVGAFFEDGSSTGVNGAQNLSTGLTDNSGAVYVFRFSSSTWFQQAYIKALNVFNATQFGWSVDLNDDGNTLAVGANQDRSNSIGVNGAQNEAGPINSGAAYVFRFSTGTSTWSQQAFIKASNAGRDDHFGYSVSISGNGNALVVGAHLEDGSAIGVEGTNNGSSTNSGAAYVFEFANDRWAQQAFIKASDTSPNARFGESVSISSDGGTIAVGARGVNTNMGAVYLY